MVQQNELLTLLVALSVSIFAISNRGGLRSLPHSPICLLAFALLVTGLTFTVLEDLLWEQMFNILEHACYGASSVLLAVWVWLVFGRGSQWQRS